MAGSSRLAAEPRSETTAALEATPHRGPNGAARDPTRTRAVAAWSRALDTNGAPLWVLWAIPFGIVAYFMVVSAARQSPIVIGAGAALLLIAAACSGVLRARQPSKPFVAALAAGMAAAIAALDVVWPAKIGRAHV